MKAAYDAIMEMPAIIIEDGDLHHEITVCGRICTWSSFRDKERVYYWDEFLDKKLDFHGVSLEEIKKFAMRPEFKEESDKWVEANLREGEIV